MRCVIETELRGYGDTICVGDLVRLGHNVFIVHEISVVGAGKKVEKALVKGVFQSTSFSGPAYVRRTREVFKHSPQSFEVLAARPNGFKLEILDAALVDEDSSVSVLDRFFKNAMVPPRRRTDSDFHIQRAIAADGRLHGVRRQRVVYASSTETSLCGVSTGRPGGLFDPEDEAACAKCLSVLKRASKKAGVDLLFPVPRAVRSALVHIR